MSPLSLSQDESHLRTYLAAQINGLCKLLVKFTGESTTEKCKRALMDLIARRGWRVTVVDGALAYEGALPSLDVYAELFDQFAASVINILGTKMVVDEMHRVDQAAGPDIRRSADRAGLTTVFIKYL